MSLFAELKRRNVFRVAAAYAVVAWLLIQVASTTFPQLHLPDWAPSLVTVLLLIGFPIALLLAWAFDLTPEGIRMTRGEAAVAQPETARGRKLDYLLIAGLVLVVAVTLWTRLAPRTGETASEPATVAVSPSIAVLPFVDMSPEGDQGWFGDGIAEQVLDELTRLEGLRVAGRTSSFAYKDSKESLQAIGAALNVATLLEGSVRRDGDQIRITAQLIKVEDGFHLWSQSWDQQLQDIFMIQDQIAKAVAGELGVRLGVGGVNTFLGAGTRNIEAYETYLKCSQANYSGQFDTAARWCTRAIELDPDYAAAWSLKGLATASRMWEVSLEQAPLQRDEAFGYVRRALELDPGSALSWSLYGTILYARTEWNAAHEAQQKALLLWPNRNNLNQYANQLFRAGRISAALQQYAATEAVEPLGGRPAFLHFNANLAQGRFDEARKQMAWTPEQAHPYSELLIQLNQGRDPAVRDTLLAINAVPGVDPRRAALNSDILSVFEKPEEALAVLRRHFDDSGTEWPWKRHDIALLAAWFGDPEFALEVLDIEVRGTVVRMGALWYPLMSEVRKLPAFKQLVRDLNLVDYWRAYGWADQCRPLGETDFSCN